MYCRGYRVVLDPSPHVIGCPDCDKEHGGVATIKVLLWPEAHRAIARKLDEREAKNDGADDEPDEPEPHHLPV
jgi:hypothetical protein